MHTKLYTPSRNGTYSLYTYHPHITNLMHLHTIHLSAYNGALSPYL